MNPYVGGFKTNENALRALFLYSIYSTKVEKWNHKKCPHRAFHWVWRRERDSNPRYPCEYTNFPGLLLQPLGHLSF